MSDVMAINSPTASVEIRADRPTVSKTLNAASRRLDNGQLVTVGDRTWSANRVRVVANVTRDNLQALLDAARTANSLTVGGSVVYVHGVRSIRKTRRPLGHQVELVFIPQGPMAGVKSAAQVLTFAGQVVTYSNEPVTYPAGGY